MTDAATPQPQPTHTEASTQVVPRVMAHVRDYQLGAGHPERIGEAVCDDLEARLKFGLEKYGFPLETHNGRDALMDAYQESLDALNYTGQHRIETIEARDPNDTTSRNRTVTANQLFYATMALAFSIKEAIIARDSH